MDDNTYITISALQHYAYCPRQFALIHVEQAWEDNQFTAEGQVLHKRVDSGESEQRGNVRFERGVSLRSDRHRLVGKMDLLEIETSAPNQYIPVEYKRGKPKHESWDRIQLCAQALCLEDMRGVSISEGALWYWQVRKRQSVTIDESLREITLDAVKSAHDILSSGRTPPPTEDQKKCRACSLIDLCEPDVCRNDDSARYLRDMFSDEKTT